MEKNLNSKYISFDKQQLKGALVRYGNYVIRIGDKHPDAKLTYLFNVETKK